jgi:hypothetical protein
MWVDAEASETAIFRREFVAAARSIVRHRHPVYDRTTVMDDVYRLGMETQVADRELFASRRPMFTPAR